MSKQDRHRQDLTDCVQTIRRDQAAQRRNQVYLVALAVLLWVALGMMRQANAAASILAFANVLLLLAAALTAMVLLAWPK